MGLYGLLLVLKGLDKFLWGRMCPYLSSWVLTGPFVSLWVLMCPCGPYKFILVLLGPCKSL